MLAQTDGQTVNYTYKTNGSDYQINTIRPTDIRLEGQLEERTDRRTNRYTCKGYITTRKADQSYKVWTNQLTNRHTRKQTEIFTQN